MAIDNGGTKNNQGLLRFQSGLDIYRSTIYSDLGICSLVSCSNRGCQPWIGPELFTKNHYLATSPGQTESNEIDEPDAWLCEDGGCIRIVA